MARKSRIFIEETMQYIALVSDEAAGMFVEKEDFDFFLSLLRELVGEYALSLHAYTLLPHSFEALVTPSEDEALSKFMQLLARRYVHYYNKKYNHKGTLWKRRYVSLLVDDEYLYDVIKYIETKALRFLENEKEYLYSSIRVNLGHESSGFIEHHHGFLSQKYKKEYALFLPQKQQSFIDSCIEKQHTIGSSRFIQRIEEKTGLSLRVQARGRPKKNNSNQRISMYKNLVVLDREKHKDLKISPLENLFFAKDVSSIALTHSEIKLVGKDFPVVLTNSENPSFMALLSLGQANLALNEEGKWLASYVPATIRKYPFAVVQSNTEKDKNIIVIDEESSLFSKSKGKQLFKKSGDISDTLKESIDFVSLYDKEMKITQAVAKEIKESGILEEKEIRVNNESESKVLVNGFCAVNEERLNKLDKEILDKWEERGILALIKAHLESLKNIQNLFVLAKNRQV